MSMAHLEGVQSQRDDARWFQPLEPMDFTEDTLGQERNLLMIYRDIRLQEIRGFGGALTQAAAGNYVRLPAALQRQFLRACYGADGLHYSWGRVPIGSCDFSSGNYSYCDTPGDTELAGFDVGCDEADILPLLRAVNEYRGQPLTLLASPWSPPAWMKSNGQMCGGGELLPQYYATWAAYVVKYLLAYRRKGMPVKYITVQNEPKATQKWESCVYSAGQEAAMAAQYLAPALRRAGLADVGIVVWDHNKERVFTRAREMFADRQVRDAVTGIGFHWYSGDHFDNLRLCRAAFPEKELIFTEGCVELGVEEGVSPAKSPWKFGERYGHDMIGNFNAGMNAFLDWNLLLDMQGGPNHVQNYCGAPVICDTAQAQLLFQPSYCYIGHFSRFVPAGSRCAAHSLYTSRLEAAVFVTPKEECVAVVMNPQEETLPLCLKDTVTGRIAGMFLPPRSITTLQYR